MSRLAKFAWTVLAYNVGVIVWGAYVRATGSGAGCGSHWPLCNGVALPRGASVTTLIEFSHRASSGVALLGVVALLVWTWRARPSGDPARIGAVLSVVFMLSEAALGAALVLFGLVGSDASAVRAGVVGAHLLNTFVLLATMALTAWWLSGGDPLRVAGRATALAGVLIGSAALLLVSTSGAVTALGDTLFPSASLSAGFREDLSTTAHFLIRLRVIHPLLAAATALALIVGAPRLARGRGPTAERLGHLVALLAGLQVAAGLLNVVLLAPVWMQLAHLALADAVWIAFVLLGAAALADRPARA